MIVDFLDVDDDHAIAVIVAGSSDDLVAATQHVLSNQRHRHVRIARLGEVAEASAANESAFALRIEPAYGFSIRNDWSEWRALFAAWSTSTLAAALTAALLSTTTAATTLSPAALIATAASVVTMFAVTLIALALPATAFAATTTATLLLAAHGLLVVLLL